MAAMEADSLTADIIALFHQREAKLRGQMEEVQTELAKLAQTRSLLTGNGAIRDTIGAATQQHVANGAESLVVMGDTRKWSDARRRRHSRMMKKRWADQKKGKK